MKSAHVAWIEPGGVDAEDAQPQIYVYDIATGSVTLGAKISEGYYFEQIRLIED